MNVKPGDLAIIVDSAYEENLGKIVQVIRASAKYDKSWECEAFSFILGTLLPSRRSAMHPPGARFISCDSSLRPISGLPLGDSADDSIPEPIASRPNREALTA